MFNPYSQAAIRAGREGATTWEECARSLAPEITAIQVPTGYSTVPTGSLWVLLNKLGTICMIPICKIHRYLQDKVGSTGNDIYG
jgi:hypothetical protein